MIRNTRSLSMPRHSPKAPTFGGEGQEHHTLQPVLETVKSRLNTLGIRKDIFKGRDKPIITAETAFANETDMEYLYKNKVDAYIPDNQFRSRGPKFQDQKAKYGELDLYLSYGQ